MGSKSTRVFDNGGTIVPELATVRVFISKGLCIKT